MPYTYARCKCIALSTPIAISAKSTPTAKNHAITLKKKRIKAIPLSVDRSHLKLHSFFIATIHDN